MRDDECSGCDPESESEQESDDASLSDGHEGSGEEEAARPHSRGDHCERPSLVHNSGVLEVKVVTFRRQPLPVVYRDRLGCILIRMTV